MARHSWTPETYRRFRRAIFGDELENQEAREIAPGSIHPHADDRTQIKLLICPISPSEKVADRQRLTQPAWESTSKAEDRTSREA